MSTGTILAVVFAVLADVSVVWYASGGSAWCAGSAVLCALLALMWTRA